MNLFTSSATPVASPRPASWLAFSLCLTLLTACGGGGGGGGGGGYSSSQSDGYSSPASSSSSLASSSIVSSSVVSSSVASSSAISSSSSSSASSLASAASSAPVALVDPGLNSADGEYFVAQGEVLVSQPDGGNTSFTSQLVNRQGFSLYTFAVDSPGVSNCNGACLVNWPALLANPGDTAQAPYSIIERSMGTAGTALQWAYHGYPLYFFAGDTSAGNTNGKAIANWLLARPVPVAVFDHSTRGELLIAHGHILDASGNPDNSRADFTLYTFDPDPIGETTCFGGCLAVWPALYAADDAQDLGDFTVIARDANTRQWAYKGKPLYFYIGDTQAGDVTGEYTDWTIARP